MIGLTCPNCQAKHQVPDEMAGKKARCSSCWKPLIVAAIASTAAKKATASVSTPGVNDEVAFACEGCFETYYVTGDMAKRRMRCRKCGGRLARVPARPPAAQHKLVGGKSFLTPTRVNTGLAITALIALLVPLAGVYRNANRGNNGGSAAISRQAFQDPAPVVSMPKPVRDDRLQLMQEAETSFAEFAKQFHSVLGTAVGRYEEKVFIGQGRLQGSAPVSWYATIRGRLDDRFSSSVTVSATRPYRAYGKLTMTVWGDTTLFGKKDSRCIPYNFHFTYRGGSKWSFDGEEVDAVTNRELQKNDALFNRALDRIFEDYRQR